MPGGRDGLAAACDLVYVADDGRIRYPPVRSMSPPDMAWQPWLFGLRRAMEALLTGDWITGAEAVEWGFANRASPGDDLDDAVLAVASRVPKIPGELLSIEQAGSAPVEAVGIRTGIRATTELPALGFHQRSSGRTGRRRRAG